MAIRKKENFGYPIMSSLNRYTIDLVQPSTTVESEASELLRVAEILSYPLIIRPSTSAGSENIKIIHNSRELQGYID